MAVKKGSKAATAVAAASSGFAIDYSAPGIVKKWVMNCFANRLTIVQIGVGGTGAYVARDVAKVIAGLTDLQKSNITYLLVDGDNVEPKNLIRQNFITPDLGRNKAVTVVERYSAAFGIMMGAVPSMFSHEWAKSNIPQTQATLLIDCVDNPAARNEIHSYYREVVGRGDNAVAIISSGNTEWTGQVAFCGKASNANSNLTQNPALQIIETPCVYDVWPELVNMKAEAGLSCAELAEANKQQMVTNQTAAQLVTMFASNVILQFANLGNQQEFAIDTACVMFGVQNMSFTRLPFANSWLAEKGYPHQEVLRRVMLGRKRGEQELQECLAHEAQMQAEREARERGEIADEDPEEDE